MTKFLSMLFVFCISFLFSSQATADAKQHFNVKKYIYDHEGNPIFVKIYVEEEALSTNLGNESFLMNLLQKDHNGYFLPAAIRKKHKHKKDKEEEGEEQEERWTCPLCGTSNPESASFCTNSECPLYRKGWRDWYK